MVNGQWSMGLKRKDVGEWRIMTGENSQMSNTKFNCSEQTDIPGKYWINIFFQ